MLRERERLWEIAQALGSDQVAGFAPYCVAPIGDPYQIWPPHRLSWHGFDFRVHA